MRNILILLGLLLLSGLFLLNGCKTMAQLMKEKIELKPFSSNFELIHNQIILNDNKIDGKNRIYPFMFDTGFTFSAITDTTIIENYSQRKFGTLISTKTVNNIITKFKTINIDFENSLILAKNLFAHTYMRDSISCSDKYFSGIIGIFPFYGENAILEINFDKKNISVLSKDFDKTDFEEIESKLKKGHFYIRLNIAGVEDYYFFDTGNNDAIVVNSTSVNLNNFIPTEEREGIIFFTAKEFDNYSELKIYKDFEIKTSSHTVKSNIHISSSITTPNVGMRFIQQFNWILDFKNKKIYAQKRANLIQSEKSQPDYLVYPKENKLVIFHKNKNANKYKLGDEIISVNDVQVKSDNICEIQNLLNQTTEWNDLKIQIK
jgi:hypothetical protein